MVDFIKFDVRPKKRSKTSLEVYPKFIIKKSKDLMIRGGDFYAIWLESQGLWSLDEQDVIDLIDLETRKAVDEYSKKDPEIRYFPALMSDSESGIIDAWHKYCQKQMRDSYHQLDDKIIFSNDKLEKSSYATKRLDYPLQEGNIEAYDKLMSTLYSPEERDKLEWAIGSIVSGDSKKIQKFMVLYGPPGSGKSTVLNLISKLFEGYCVAFESSALASTNNNFALEAFALDPLIAIEHEGDLSRIETNTRINSLVAHEAMRVNEKFKSPYSMKFRAFLFIGTNKVVKITDAKSGLMRRLIDVSPTGNKLSRKEYSKCIKQMDFELGAIAKYCLDRYLEDPSRYDDYQPINMLGASNDFYNFIEDSFPIFKKGNRTTLKASWELYKQYCEEARVGYPLSQRAFKEELKNYFEDFKEQAVLDDGSRVRSLYLGFKEDKFSLYFEKNPSEEISENILKLESKESIFDKEYAEVKAQYASTAGTPVKSWDDVATTLKDLDTSKEHYVLLPESHIVVDFDLSGETDEETRKINLKEASKWPKTYAEFSRSGNKVHLHYIYDGDVSKLSRIYSEKIEIKIFTGKSALRRRLSYCNDEQIAHISSGLPLKGDKKVVNFDAIKNEKAIRTMIMRNLNREYHANTAPSIDFISKILEDAYKSGVPYDVSDMRNAILMFAMGSTNQSSKCVSVVNKMKFKSEEPSESIETEAPIAFYDVEVFPNLLLIRWKLQGPEATMHEMFNPTPEEVTKLMKYRLIGFYCRNYDNHIIYARQREYSIDDIFKLSSRLTSGDDSAKFREAYNVSYTDVYDFCSKKQSLKKWEIELGIHHQELGFPWDRPVPKEKWPIVSEYCGYDVLATEAVFNARQGDWAARQIQAKLANGSVNDTTNQLSTKLIFGNDRNPQSQFNYRFMGEVDESCTCISCVGRFDVDPTYTVFDYSKGPYACVFPGYTYQFGKSVYRGVEIGEGGNVYAEPGMYVNIALLDIAGMHPSTIIAEELFGKLYTKRFKDIKDARIAIKHHDYETAKTMLDGALADYISELESGETWFTAEDLSQALKIVVNSIYGLTAAKFDNKFRDKRNKDNIVAKRGALFMENLKHEVQNKGFTVAHIKTDSIKIPNATPDIIEFVSEYGKLYGYEFEHEATYERMCLVNDSVYIAKYATVDYCKKLYGAEYVDSSPEIVSKCKKKGGEWTPTGTQFQIPYVFKKLFTHEDIEFKDLCETKSVTTALYLDMNEKLSDAEPLEKELKTLNQKYPSWESSLNIPALEYEAVVNRIQELEQQIANCHKYVFVGKVGRFTPMQKGVGAGELVREAVNKKTGEKTYPSAGGAKGYRWMESEMVENLGLKDKIDISYYNTLAEDAISDISKYGNFDWFVSGDIVDADANILPF